MNWLNIELKVLRSPEYLGSTPEQRATWLNLMAFCADHENGGKMECLGWGNRKWMQLVGVTLEEVEDTCELWHWENYGILVCFYPLTQEQKVKRNRKNGKKGGRPSDDKPCAPPCAPPSGSVSLKRNSNSNSKGNSKEKKTTTDYGFESVWVLYGRKGNKQSAKAYWEKLSSADRDSISARIPAYMADRPDAQYRLDFSGYINPAKRRWEDKLKSELSADGKKIVVEDLGDGQFRVEIVGSMSRADKNIFVKKEMLDRRIASGEWIK